MKTGKPSRRPTIQLWQTEPIPVQLQEGTPVTATLQVSVDLAEYPPYDFVWRVDQAQATSPLEHSPQIIMTGLPHPGGTPGQVDTLTRAHIAVVDSSGQAVEASAPVRSQRAAQRPQSVRHPTHWQPPAPPPPVISPPRSPAPPPPPPLVPPP